MVTDINNRQEVLFHQEANRLFDVVAFYQ